MLFLFNFNIIPSNIIYFYHITLIKLLVNKLISMFGLFKKKSEKQTLEAAYQKLTKEFILASIGIASESNART